MLGLLAPATACGDGEPVPAVAAVVLRDSAGIRIVENTGPEWPADSGWTIGESPRVTIGLVDGEEPYLLDRVAGAVLNRDGLIVITREPRNCVSSTMPAGTSGPSAGRVADPASTGARRIS